MASRQRPRWGTGPAPTDRAIHLAERLRDAGVPVILGAQSPKAWATSANSGGSCTRWAGAWSCTRPPTPTLVTLAGTIRTPEQPGSWMPGGRPAKPAST
jgi:hypothetical protein